MLSAGAGMMTGCILRLVRTFCNRASMAAGVAEYSAQSEGPARWQKW